ncbi:MAG TPA: phosphotransferase [Solirubrobacteraceae bacterium]|nr:phosphotransferase [Solirubrobacteraceae bacterium]
MSAPAGLVHGLAGDLVAPDWPPLTDEEARWVAERWALPWASGSGTAEVRVRWHSPRPLSAAGLIGAAGAQVFVKRHDSRVRDPDSLAPEHRFARHLRAAGLEAPDVLRTPDGLTAVVRATAVYEVHACAPGADLYSDAESWTGFRTREHARAAGELLARLHLAARGFEARARPFGPIVDSDEIVTALDPIGALGMLSDARPGLAAGLAPRPWRREVAEALGDLLTESARRAGGLERGWTHGDWHPSNVTWSPDGTPVAVLDLGLSNRTTVVRDVAIAIERSCVSWLEATPVADLETVDSLLAGYTSVRPLSDAEWGALPALTATAHVEFALSEVEYYAGVLRSPERAEVAYRDYLIGHARWFATDHGRKLLDALAAARSEPLRS